MFILMISSIILKLISAHYLLEFYRKKKIDLFLTLLALLLICGFIINDFAALNFFLRESVSRAQWFMVFLTFAMSLALLGFMIRIKQTQITLDEMTDNKVMDELSVLLRSAEEYSKNRPMVVITKEKNIIHMNDGFKDMIGINNCLSSDFTTNLDRLFERNMTHDEILMLNMSVEKIVGPSKFECYYKVSAYTDQTSSLIALFFDDYSKEMLLIEEQKITKEKINYYEELLNVGQWSYYFSDNIIQCSEKVQELLTLKENKLAYDNFKKMVHPEDLMLINILDSKTLWINGLHTRHMRLKCASGIKYVTIHYKPINDDKGLPIGASGIVQENSEQRNYIARQLLKEKNDHISSFVVEINNYVQPLLSTLKEEQSIHYAHDEIERVLDILLYNEKKYTQGKHNHLISADKCIDEIFQRFTSVCDCSDIKLNLNSQHMLLAIDEMSFKQVISHLLTEFTSFQFRVPLYVKTVGNNKCLSLKCELGIHPMLGEFAHTFKQKLLTPPQDIQDGSLFHAYTIIKKFNGTLNLYSSSKHYGLEIELPAINMAQSDQREPLDQILYYGDYPILREITKTFLKKFEVELINLFEGNTGIGDYKVVIFDESISVGQQLLLANKHPKIQFLSFGLPELLKGNNIMSMQQPFNMSDLTTILGERFELTQVSLLEEKSKGLYNMLEEIDRYNIDASHSCKRNGHNAILYFESLKLYNLYYGNKFDKVRMLWETKNLEKLEAMVLKMQNEASVLGLVMIDDFLKSLQLNGYELLEGMNGQVLYKQAFASLENSIKIIM